MVDSVKSPEELGREWAADRNLPVKTIDEIIASHNWHPHGPEANQFLNGVNEKQNSNLSRLFEEYEDRGRAIDTLGNLNLEVRGADGLLKNQPLSEVFSYAELGEMVDSILKSVKT